MPAQNVVLTSESALFLVGQPGSHNGRWRIVLFECDPGAVAVVTIEDLSILVDVDRDKHAALGDVGLQRLELPWRHGRHQLVFIRCPNAHNSIPLPCGIAAVVLVIRHWVGAVTGAISSQASVQPRSPPVLRGYVCREPVCVAIVAVSAVSAISLSPASTHKSPA